MIQKQKFQKEKELRSLADEIRQSEFIDVKAGIQGLLKKHDLDLTLRVKISGDMERIIEYLAISGTSICFAEPVLGWKELKTAVLYHYWAKRIQIKRKEFLSTTAKIGIVEEYTEYAAIGLPLCPQYAEFLLRVLDDSMRNQRLNWYPQDHYPVFLVRLYRKLAGHEDLADRDFLDKAWEHPYDLVFDGWDDKNKLAEAITKMCDYHLKWNTYTKRKGHESEFRKAVHCVNPVEIHALEYVRKQLGLSTPKVKHDLLEPPFYPIPPEMDAITEEAILEEDTLLREIIQKNKEWLESPVTAPETNARSATDSCASSVFVTNVFVSDTVDAYATVPGSVPSPSSVENPIRAYFFQMSRYRELFGSHNTAVIDQVSPAVVDGLDVRAGVRRIINGQQADAGRPAEEDVLGWEALCQHIGEPANVLEFIGLRNPMREAVKTILMPIQILPQEKESLVFVAEQDMISHFMSALETQVKTLQGPFSPAERHATLGLAILMQIAARYQANLGRQLSAEEADALLANPDFSNTAMGIASLYLRAEENKKDVIVFLSPKK